MAMELHDENGLDLETSIHLLPTYVLSVLVYMLEVVLPKETLIDKIYSSSNRVSHYRSQWQNQQYISGPELCRLKLLFVTDIRCRPSREEGGP